MASTKDLKKRIGTVKNTQQTTRAMKMVSAAKLRRAQEAITAQRPYAKQVQALIELMVTLQEKPIASPLVERDLLDATPPIEGEGKPKVLLVLVTSDRGLCGGFNGNVIKAAQRWIRANQSLYSEVRLGFVGRKGHDIFKTKWTALGPYLSEISGKVVFTQAKKFADALIAEFTSGRSSEVKIIYNEFKNAVTQQIQVEDFLPLRPSSIAPLKDPEQPVQGDTPIYLVKPSPAEVLELLLKKHFAIQAYRILLESQASEHGARMSAMENATKNAGEMIRDLTLQYNKQRQAGITKELLEIIAGSESQKAG